MRLFAALYPPAAALDDLTAALPALGPDWRPASPENWHITLAFYGELAAPDRLARRLARAAARTPPLRLRLSGAGVFGASGRRPGGVLWVGVAGDVAGLRGLAMSCRAAGRREGAPGVPGAPGVTGVTATGGSARTGAGRGEERFRAHVTLARRRSAPGRADATAPPRPRASSEVAALGHYTGPEFDATELVLVRSRLGAAAVHEPLVRLPLVGDGPGKSERGGMERAPAAQVVP